MADGNAALRGPTLRRRPSYRALPSPGAARPCPRGPVTFSCEPPRKDEPRHFLDACALCRAPLRASKDIYMYRGDTPFCSEECRQEQIELDEVLEREASARRKMWGRGTNATTAKPAATLIVEAVVAR